MNILGIDPGGASTGYGLVRLEAGKLERIRSGEIRPPRKSALSGRLEFVHSGVKELLRTLAVDEIAVEDLYQGVNPRTASRIGHVRGVILRAAAESGIPIFEYPPNEVKSAVVGNGLATKEQVRFMVQRILSLSETISSSDESDALAVAICHCHRCGEGVPGR